ncbi:glycosyltransferase family 2 protein, partial [Adlercreutzia sp. ZJ242]|uniref:glycosyltransferase family 2 protein n=1 Tax=Adlercreutzia sp. ZJ242 TaxID=2709409 RepID=UPI0013EDCF96
MSKFIPLVSIVVPFYNLQDCASRCLDSILVQDFVDFEVVCVDDGSSDKTGEILDSYARLDERIRVLHRDNGGLSAARNSGVSASRGAFVSFVDGDDVVHPRYLSQLWRALEGREDRMAICGAVRIADGTTVPDDPGHRRALRVMDCSSAAFSIIFNEISEAAWGKLAPRRIFIETPFPEGQLYEDQSVVCAHLAAVSDVAVVDERLYGYVMRDGSIVNVRYVDLGQIADYEEAIERFCSDAGSSWPELVRYLTWWQAFCAVRIHSLASRLSDEAKGREIDE